MKIILSPAKKMNADTDGLAPLCMPLQTDILRGPSVKGPVINWLPKEPMPKWQE